EAAEEGDPKGQFLHGYASRIGLWCDSDFAAAERWMDESVRHGLPEAQTLIGLHLAYQNGDEDHLVEQRERLDQAKKLLLKAADQRFGPAHLGLAWLYMDGKGVPRDSSAAVQYLKKGAEDSNPECNYLLGKAYWLEELGLSKNLTSALEHLESSAKAGFPSGQNLLGELLTSNELPHDEGRAESLFRRAADAGDATARYNLQSLLTYQRRRAAAIANATRTLREIGADPDPTGEKGHERLLYQTRQNHLDGN
ncbi:MAG: sel1 repeat family protein, partial [Planctomycetales bacterium]|nr:sel1 repeat family protein [Planctomycetales bacterium]